MARREAQAREWVRALAESAAELRQRTEPQFLQLSSDLTSLHEAAAELGRTIREVIGSVRQALADSQLSGAGALAERSLDELRGSVGEAESKAQVLQQSSEAMGRLRAHGAQMERSASLLDVSRYGFAVESARTRDTQQAFETFVPELQKLAARVRELGLTIGEEAGHARGEAERVTRSMHANFAGLRELTAEAEAAVRQISERVEAVQQRCWSTLEGVELGSGRISAHTSDAVYHLQLGDIVRQKLEHIEAALEEPEHGAHVLSVQIGQLDLIASEIAASHRQLEQAFDGLAEETTRLIDTTENFGSTGDHRETGDPIEELRAAFAKVAELRSRGSHWCRQAEDTAIHAVETANRLSPYLAEVAQINQQMHLQALNAIVKTARLGADGRTLEVLSMHVQQVFEESSGMVEETEQLIESISATTAAAGAVAAAEADTSVELQQELERSASMRAKFLHAMEEAARHARFQESRLDQARTRLAFLGEMGGEIAALRQHLEDARLALAGAAGMRSAAHPPAALDRYTIASEREVHRQIVGAAEAPALPDPLPPQASPLAAAADEESLGDNVELF